MIALKPYLRQTADQYKLDDWVAKPAERRKKYFLGIDNFRRDIAGIHGREPGEDQIVRFLMLALEYDGTFESHISQWQNGAKLTEEAFWKQLWEAAASVLLSSYEVACTTKEWPEAA